MIIKKVDYNLTEITALEYDSSEYLWIAFKKNSENVCLLQKVSANNIEQVYYEIELEVDNINALHIFGLYIYVAVDDNTNFVYKIHRTSPLTNQTILEIPTGITSSALEILDDNTDVYFLINDTNSKILKYDTSLTLQDTITLTAITNVKSFTIDSNNDIWVITNEAPSKLIRVYEASGGYLFDTTILE